MILVTEGASPREVARRVQASVASVDRWRWTWVAAGQAALAAKPTPGAPRQLTDRQRQPLVPVLLHGARAHGVSTERWTLKCGAAVMRVHFGVR